MKSMTNSRSFAVITGASTGIGYELAKRCAEERYDLLIAADEEAIHEAAGWLRAIGVTVDAIEVDLATTDGVDRLYGAAQGRAIDVLLANAGHGLGKGFLDQEFTEAKHVVDTNITGTIYLLQKVGHDRRSRGQGRILIVGSIAGFMSGSFQAVYNGTKAFLDSFSFALRNELKGSGVTVTCLMPGATDTDFFKRADMQDTKFAQDRKDDPADVARQGFDAMMRGDGDIVTGWKNKVLSAMASVIPSDMLAEINRRKAKPGTGKKAA